MLDKIKVENQLLFMERTRYFMNANEMYSQGSKYNLSYS